MKQHLGRLRDRLILRFLDTRAGRNLVMRSVAPRTRSMTIELGDHCLTVSPSDYIGRSVFAKGHFDRDHVDRLMAILRQRKLAVDGTVLLELGANIGTHTVYFALTGAFQRIVSVEPDPRNFQHLLANVGQNGLNGLVLPVNCAAGEVDGEIDFYLHPTNHGRSSPLRRNATDIQISVPVKPVPVILEDAGVAARDIGLVWMDIEGYEPVALRSMHDLLARQVPVYMEFSPEFYGREPALALVEHLAGFYADCLVFHEDVQTPTRVREIPLDGRQFDVLLLP